MMKNILFIVLIILLNSCNSIENDGKKDDPEKIDQLEVLIDGIGWTDYYENDKVKKSEHGAIIGTRNNFSEFYLSIQWRIDYQSHFHETINLRIFFTKDFDVDDFHGMEIDFQQADNQSSGIFFSEWDYDVRVSEYNRYDSTEAAKAKITYFNYEEKIVEVEFEGKLILADYIMERPDHSEWNKRPDTLHITNGRIRTIFQDLRPEQ